MLLNIAECRARNRVDGVCAWFAHIHSTETYQPPAGWMV